MALLSASDLRCPVTTTTTSRASRTVPTPTVRADDDIWVRRSAAFKLIQKSIPMRGTAAISLLKKRALARIVSYASVLMRVLETSDDPVEEGWNICQTCH